MDKIYIKVDRKTGMVYLDNTVIGRDNENLQQELIFSFENGFVLGSPRLEYKIVNNKYHIPMEIDGENYKIPVKNILTKEGRVEMQLVIVEQAQNEEIPIFKSNVFYMYCNKSINAQEEAPDDYEYWLDVLEEKIVEMDEALTEVDNLDIDVNKSGTTTTIEITKKDGTTDTVEILDGEQGIPGRDGYTPQKGIDYFTQEDIESLNIPTKLSELTDDLGSSPVHTHSQYLTEHQDISMKQNIEDNTLNTTNKTVPSAINEVNSIAKGANQALSYSNYQSMINVFNSLANNVYNVGQNVMIVTLNVPDLWISRIESTSTTYTYTTDEAFTTELATNGYVQVGYYRFSALETQKVDLTNYVQFNDYPSGANAGVIKTLITYATSVDGSGRLTAQGKGYQDYTSGSGNMFISKTTLENVIAGKGLVSNTDYATGSKGGTVRSGGFGINVNSTGQMFGVVHSYAQYNTDDNTQVISKGTLENVITGKGLTTKSYVDGLVGNIDSVLDAINGEVI